MVNHNSLIGYDSLMPDTGLPEGKYYVKIIGYVRPVSDEEAKLLNG